MTRFLSEALQAREPYFRQGLHHLETVNGQPNHDIQLSVDVQQAAAAKLRQLGLDPSDTTAEELYHTLIEKVKADDARLTRALQTRAATHVSATGDVVSGMAHALREVAGDRDAYALKATSLRTLLRKQPPKKAMKQLNYRSLDSFLKHESPAAWLAAAWLTETTAWQNQLLERYKHLGPSDFEVRHVAIIQPTSKRWTDFAQAIVADRRHNLLGFKELGAVVLLPLPANPRPGVVTVSLLLALQELNDIQSCSTYLKLCQVRPDFGGVVFQVVTAEPRLGSRLLDQPVSWRLIQHYYARLKDRFQEELFGPHIRPEDLSWHAVEQGLARIEPKLEFWRGSSHLGLLHNRRLVSLNLLDAALNLCNNLPFEQRLVQAFQHSLWHELLLKYLNRDTVEQTIADQLQPQLTASGKS